MSEHGPMATDRSVLLDQYITELISLAKARCPEADMELSSTRYEDEDAHVLVFLPEGIGESDIDKLGEALTNRSVEILLDAGLLILVGVYEASQRRAQTRKPIIAS